MKPPFPDTSGDGLCPNCGAVVGNRQKFCSCCGALLSPSSAPLSKRDFAFWRGFLPLVLFAILAGTMGACSTLALVGQVLQWPPDLPSVLFFLPLGALPLAACYFLMREIRRRWLG